MLGTNSPNSCSSASTTFSLAHTGNPGAAGVFNEYAQDVEKDDKEEERGKLLTLKNDVEVVDLTHDSDSDRGGLWRVRFVCVFCVC